MRLLQLLSLAIFLSVGIAEAQTSLESTALAPLINRANKYLSVGKFSDAVRSYSEAIGEPVIVASYLRVDDCHQSRHPLTIYSITSALPLISQ